jgi:hypothetical protein
MQAVPIPYRFFTSSRNVMKLQHLSGIAEKLSGILLASANTDL